MPEAQSRAPLLAFHPRQKPSTCTEGYETEGLSDLFLFPIQNKTCTVAGQKAPTDSANRQYVNATTARCHGN